MSSPQNTPAGWYPNAHGELQWWDGSQWGPVAPQQEHISNARTVRQQPVTYVTPVPGIKSAGVAYAFLLLLGGFGAHRFYLGHGYGAFLLILWIVAGISSFMPSDGWAVFAGICYFLLGVLLIIDLFFLARMVRQHNEEVLTRSLR